MSNWLSQKIRDTANKAKGALKQAIKPQYSAEEIQKILKEADRKEDEFNSEKGTIDVHLANGEALNSLINGRIMFFKYSVFAIKILLDHF